MSTTLVTDGFDDGWQRGQCEDCPAICLYRGTVRPDGLRCADCGRRFHGATLDYYGTQIPAYNGGIRMAPGLTGDLDPDARRSADEAAHRQGEVPKKIGRPKIVKGWRH